MSNDKRAADDAEREEALKKSGHHSIGINNRLAYRDGWNDCRAALSRADGGKDSSDAALDALKRAEQFIVNGTEFGYIRMPDAPDPALDTLPAIRKAITAIAKEKK